MVLQIILIGILFAGAAYYLGKQVYSHFYSGSSCASGCGKCGAVDFEKIEKQIRASS